MQYMVSGMRKQIFAFPHTGSTKTRAILFPTPESRHPREHGAQWVDGMSLPFFMDSRVRGNDKVRSSRMNRFLPLGVSMPLNAWWGAGNM